MSAPIMISLPREDLQAIFDIAVEGEGMMSGWWGQEEVDAARKIAVLLGVDPMVATPQVFARKIPHKFERPENAKVNICKWCRVFENEHGEKEEEA